MTDIANLLTPIYDLLQDEVVREKVEESARVFFSNSNLTINLIPALIIGALGLLFLLPLLGIPILDILGGMMSDVVGGHGGGYSAPSTGYGYVARGDTSYYDQTIADLQQYRRDTEGPSPALCMVSYVRAPPRARGLDPKPY